jgi:hypothetical protein
VGLNVLYVGSTAFVVAGVGLMTLINRKSIRQYQRRRKAWKAAGGEGPSPDEGLRGTRDDGSIGG